jgi:hypothetical protein
MTSIPSIIDETEAFLRGRAEAITKPREGECLCCYVSRLLDEFPCDGSLRHALHYRDVAAPRATALADRLGGIGGYCDCEVFMNGYQLRDAPGAGDVYGYIDVDEEETDVAEEPQIEVPPCQGVRRGSAQPCRNWIRIRRWR